MSEGAAARSAQCLCEQQGRTGILRRERARVTGAGRGDALSQCLRARSTRDTPYAGVAVIFTSALRRGEDAEGVEDGGERRDFGARARYRRRHGSACETQSTGVRAFNVGSGTPRTVGEMACALSEALDGPAHIHPALSPRRRPTHHGGLLAPAQ